MTRDLSWDALRVFIAVYRSESITGAAVDLGMAQASVSAQIAKLEQRLDLRLFDRIPTGVIPTDRGRALAAQVTEAADAMTAATRDIDGSEPSEVHSVVIGGPREFLSRIVLPALADQLPELHVRVSFGHADELIDSLENRTLDLLVSSVQPRRRGLAYQPIYDEEFVLVGHPRWRAEARRDLDAIPVLAYADDLPIVRRYWRSVFGRRPARLVPTVIAPDLQVLTQLAIQGTGMSVLPDYLVRGALGDGRLILLHEPAVAPLNTVYVATRRGFGSNPVVHTVRDAIVEAARTATQR